MELRRPININVVGEIENGRGPRISMWTSVALGCELQFVSMCLQDGQLVYKTVRGPTTTTTTTTTIILRFPEGTLKEEIQL